MNTQPVLSQLTSTRPVPSRLTCGFIGLGLIGGSIAKALRKALPRMRILAYDLCPDTLETAVRDHIADQACSRIDHSFHACDIIFLCAPVLDNDSTLPALKQVIAPHCILTDVGSVKSPIHESIAAAGLESHFVGGHPMAGSERVGYLNSKAALLENAYYILSPSPLFPPERLEDMYTLVSLMGAIPLVLSPDYHDYVTAAVSHLPHVIAAALVNLVRKADAGDGTMRLVAAGGFKDITRIASSSPDMWQQICLTNTENILTLLDDYMDTLREARDALAARSSAGLYRLFEQARDYRATFSNTSAGPIKISYSLNVDIADEPGALAAIATLLALQQISIKNIGITHNREFEEGVLRIELYDEPSLRKAMELLVNRGYHIHEKRF